MTCVEAGIHADIYLLTESKFNVQLWLCCTSRVNRHLKKSHEHCLKPVIAGTDIAVSRGYIKSSVLALSLSAVPESRIKLL